MHLSLKPITPQRLAITIQDAVNGTRMPHPGAYLPVFQRSTRLGGLRLLIVEDNMINRQIAEALLSSEGATVELAESGIEGVNRVIAGAEVFDAVLMDMQMPDIDGLEATWRIRTDPRFGTLPIVAMTANASKTDRDVCLAAGMNEHVGKPIDLERKTTASWNHALRWSGAQCGDDGGNGTVNTGGATGVSIAPIRYSSIK
jgi:CheY-like chemotaxis protein